MIIAASLSLCGSRRRYFKVALSILSSFVAAASNIQKRVAFFGAFSSSTRALSRRREGAEMLFEFSLETFVMPLSSSCHPIFFCRISLFFGRWAERRSFSSKDALGT